MIWGGLVMPDSTRNEDAAGPPAEADLAVELSDLRQAQAALPLPLAAPAERIGRWRPVSGWRLWRPLGVIGVVALALLAIGANLYGPAVARFFATKPVPPVTLGLRAGHIGCLVDAAWSPQGTRIALLGDGFLACGENTLPGRVAIYDARAGALVTAFNVNSDVIAAAVQTLAHQVAPPAVSVVPDSAIEGVIQFHHLLWSPDGSRLALTFTVAMFSLRNSGWSAYLPDGEPAQPIGVLLLDPLGAQAQALVRLQSVYRPDQGDESAWDLRSGTLLSSPNAPSNIGPASILPPALGYRWQPDGTLAPLLPLTSLTPPSPLPLGPVGNPAGGAAFSIWQPGFAVAVSRINDQGALDHLSGVYTWQTSIAAWSPDGRYLLVWTGQAGLLALPNRAPLTPADLTMFQLNQPWQLPLRDAGLLRVLPTIGPGDPVGDGLAWRPDGRVLAAFAPWIQSGSLPVRFYDCASGSLLATLTSPPFTAQPLPSGPDLAQWSPDGTHLLLFDPRVGTVVVWGPAQLPR
jgi:hypothetical protein